MKNTLLKTVLFLFPVCLPAGASLMELPLDEACAQSDLIVVGTLENLKPFTHKEPDAPTKQGADTEIRASRLLYGVAEGSVRLH